LLLDAQAAVLLDVARTYYQVLRSERSVAVLLASLATQDERVRDIRARQKAGIARPLDTAQTEAQAAATRVSLIAAQNDVATGRSTLSFLLGVPANDSPLVDEAQLPQAAPSLAALQDQAARQRQDLSAAVQALEAAKLSVNAAIAQYYPSVTLNVNYFLSRQSTPTESDWNYLLSANLPIFSAGLIEANVRQAWSLLRQAKLSETQVRRQVVQDVEVACQNFQASRDRLKELQVQLAAAEEALRQAEQSYRVGLATNLERLTAQDALLSAQLQLASERYNQKVFYLNLLRAAGALTTRLPGEPATAPTTAPATRPGTMPAGE
jgi:outer membrane protein TolC